MIFFKKNFNLCYFSNIFVEKCYFGKTQIFPSLVCLVNGNDFFLYKKGIKIVDFYENTKMDVVNWWYI